MIVFDKPIVNKCDSLPMIIVRMCINVGLVAMRGPSGMTQAYIVLVPCTTLKLHALYAVTSEPVTRCEFSTNKFSALRVYSHDATRVIAARLQNLQALNAYISGNWLIPDVPHDSTAFMCCM